MDSIATRWRDLSGAGDWEGLLDPLDIDLRPYIIHYGERAGVALVTEPKSKNYGLPRYAKGHLFSKIGLENGNPYKYVVKKYLYATIQGNDYPTGKSYVLGMVSVTTDEGARVLGRKDVLISWRGTQLKHEVAVDLDCVLVSASDILGKENDPMVHHGWLSYYTDTDDQSPHNQLTSARDQALAALKEVLDEYKGEEISITITGHSMGSALATLNATDIVFNGHNALTDQPDKLIPVTAFVFASPRLGNEGFKKVFSGLKNLHVLRVTNEKDPVPNLPPNLPLPIPLPLLEYGHVGKELRIDTRKSPYLKDEPNGWHDIEVYLHGVAGTQGIKSNDFKLEVKRDLSLVNKAKDYLKDEYNVVGGWWTEKNKAMIQMDDGSWVLDDREFLE